LLSGDAGHFKDNWENRRVPHINFDKEQTAASLQRMVLTTFGSTSHDPYPGEIVQLIALASSRRLSGKPKERTFGPVAIFPAQPESAATGLGVALCAIQECYYLLGSSAGLT
jgi:hypothetical protein